MNERNEPLFQEETPELLDGTFQFFGNPSEILAKYTHCPLCDSYLHFTHFTDFANNTTQEVSRCPECEMKVRNQMHRLH